MNEMMMAFLWMCNKVDYCSVLKTIESDQEKVIEYVIEYDTGHFTGILGGRWAERSYFIEYRMKEMDDKPATVFVIEKYQMGEPHDE